MDDIPCRDNETICDDDWRKWRSAEELNTRGSFFTDDIQITGDGYIKDFSMRLSPDEFVQDLNEMIEAGWWNNRMSMWCITFNAYIPSVDRFIVVQLLFDVNLTGAVTPA